MKRTSTVMVIAAALAGLTGCSGTASPAKVPGTDQVAKDSSGKEINKVAFELFNKGNDAMARHDKANSWSEAACEEVAATFRKAAAEQKTGTFHEATYNAGVAYQRCKNDAKAKAIFDEILASNPGFHRARVQVALYAFTASGQRDFDKAIAEMQKAIEDAEFKNEEALVHLAMLQMMRDNEVGDDEGANDFERAKANLQRALAINDSFMPAFNQLAVYYLEQAKKKALGEKAKGKRRGGVAVAAAEKKKADTQALELAALVCNQAVRKNPGYAPIYNTMGLISAELGDLSAAAQAFGRARQLDPKSFEAHMNYAAVNLQFRGFAQAEEAYRKALQLKPGDYEAHLGLALALRGQINDSNYDAQLAAVEKELAAARQIDPERPETYFNEAILVAEFKTKTFEGEKAEPVFEKAKTLFRDFIKKATGKEGFADAIKRAEERIKEIDEIIEFTRETREQEREAAEAAKAAEANKSATPPAGDAGDDAEDFGDEPDPQ